MAKENVISVRFLIHLVGERPALWDKSSDEYKDRALKETSWREICTYVNENYLNMPPLAKEEFTRMIMKKWTHIRDCWVKSMKYGYDEVTKKPPKPYVYHNEMEFMQKILKCQPPRYNLNTTQLSNIHFEEFYREKNETQNSNATSNELENNEADVEFCIENFKQEANASNSESQVTVVNKADNVDDIDDWHLEDTEIAPAREEQSNKQIEVVKRKRKSIFIRTRRDDEFVESTTGLPVAQPVERLLESPRVNEQRTDNCLHENRHWNFFKGILPSVTGLDEDHVLEFQAGVIVLLQKLRESQKQKFNTKSHRISVHSLYRGRGRKRKISHDNGDWAKLNLNTVRRSTRQISDPIAPEDEHTEFESDN